METQSLAFLITIGSMSRSFAKIGSKELLIRLMSHLALLKPKTSNVMQNLSEHSCMFLNWFFCIHRNCVELFLELPSPTSKPTQWLRCWFRVNMLSASWLLLAVSIWRKFIFIWALLCVAKISKASMKDDIKSPGHRAQKTNGSGNKLDKIDTEIATRFPFQIVVSVSLNFSSS